jgi:MFS transporter, CP family, cyanate transporter
MTDHVSSSTKTRPAYRWVILVQVWFIYFCFGLIMTTLSAIVTPVMSDLNLSYPQMGFILGTWQLVYTVVALPLGLVIDHIGTYKSLLIAAITISISAVLRSFAVDFTTLTISVALFGIGGSMVSVGIPKVVATWFLGKERGTATGIYVTGITVGGIAALALTNSVMIPLVGGWRQTYLLYGLVSFAVAAVWLFFGRRPPDRTDRQTAPALIRADDFRGMKNAFSKNVLLVITIGITSFLVSHGLSQGLPTILQEQGMTASEAGFAVSMVNVFLIFGVLLAPRLPYIVKSRKLAICILLLIQGISVLTISGISGPGLWTVLALRGLSGGFMPLLTVVLMDLPEVGPARMGIVGGMYFAVGEIGGFVGPSVMGLFKHATGTFTLGLIILAAICEVMILPTLFLKIDQKTKRGDTYSAKGVR